MRKTLVLDGDRSLAAIGNVKKQTEVFGFPPVACDSLEQIKATLGPLLTLKKVQVTHPLLSHVKDEEMAVRFTDKAEELGLKAIAIDTFSHMARQTKDNIEASLAKKGAEEHARTEIAVWGLFKDYAYRMLSTLKKLDKIIIVNVHGKEMDGPVGQVVVPALPTDLKKGLAEYFDCVFYAKATKVDGKKEYMWITEMDARHTLAKVRLPEAREKIPALIPQNFGTVLNIFEEAGKPDPKILIIADSGHGKTSALATINGFMPPHFNKG